MGLISNLLGQGILAFLLDKRSDIVLDGDDEDLVKFRKSLVDLKKISARIKANRAAGKYNHNRKIDI